MDARAQLGRWGEDLAVQHLQAAGCKVLARNWRCREGELDVVVRDGPAVVSSRSRRAAAAASASRPRPSGR